jgi:hypothetical protein
MDNVNRESASCDEIAGCAGDPFIWSGGVDKMGRTLGDGLDWSGLPPGKKGPVVAAMTGPSRAGTAYPGGASKLAAPSDLEAAVKRAGALICLAATLLAACSAAHGSDRALGTVTGKLVIEGGPGGLPHIRRIQGVVRFVGRGHVLVAARTNAVGVFRVRLPIGRYQVSGRSPHILEGSDGTSHQVWSASVPVIVTARHTSKITLTWYVP